MSLGPPGGASIVFQSYLRTQANSSHQTLCRFKRIPRLTYRAINRPFNPSSLESTAAQDKPMDQAYCSVEHQFTGNDIPVLSSWTEPIESPLAVPVKAIQPQITRNTFVGAVIRLISKYTCIYIIYTPYTNIYKHYTNIYGCEIPILLCTYSLYSVRMLSVYAFVYRLYITRICSYWLYMFVLYVRKPVSASIQTHTNYTNKHRQNTDNIQTIYKHIQTTYVQHTAGRAYRCPYKKKQGTTVCCLCMFV
jgi:hypothetical protein